MPSKSNLMFTCSENMKESIDITFFGESSPPIVTNGTKIRKSKMRGSDTNDKTVVAARISKDWNISADSFLEWEEYKGYLVIHIVGLWH